MNASTGSETRDGWEAIGPPGLLRTLARSWRLLLAVTLAAGLVGWMTSRAQTPSYEAQAALTLAGPGEDTIFRAANSRDLERHLLDEVEAVRSETVTEAAATQLGDGWTAEEVRRGIVVRPDVARNTMTLVGRADTGSDAVLLTHAVAVAYQEDAAAREQDRAQRQIDRLTGYFQELRTTASSAQEQLQALQREFEQQLAGRPRDEVVRLVTDRLAVDPRAQELQLERNDALNELSALEEQVRRLRIDATLRGSGVEHYEPAALAQHVRPRPLRDGALAAAIAFVLAAGVLWARAERRPARVRADEAARVLGIPVLGRVTAPVGPDAELGEVAPPDRPRYGAAANALQFTLGTGGGRTALVTGLAADGSSSVTALNLALAAARDGHRVVLVDGDLRHGRLTSRLGLEGSAGWSDAPPGPDASAPATAPYPLVTSDGVELLLVPTGTRTRRAPDRTRLAQALARLRADADLVFVDAPPVLQAADASTIAHLVDGVVIVLATEVAAEDIEQARWRLGATPAPVVGAVVLTARRRGVRPERTGTQVPAIFGQASDPGDRAPVTTTAGWRPKDAS